MVSDSSLIMHKRAVSGATAVDKGHDDLIVASIGGALATERSLGIS